MNKSIYMNLSLLFTVIRHIAKTLDDVISPFFTFPNDMMDKSDKECTTLHKFLL